MHMCIAIHKVNLFFFFNDTETTEIYTLSLHDALPISRWRHAVPYRRKVAPGSSARSLLVQRDPACVRHPGNGYRGDRKSTRLNSSHTVISYAVFCFKKKNDDVCGQVVTQVQSGRLYRS